MLCLDSTTSNFGTSEAFTSNEFVAFVAWPFSFCYRCTEALKAMEKVALHINEMQKIYEDYGTVFDQLVAEQSAEKEVRAIVERPSSKKYCTLLKFII